MVACDKPLSVWRVLLALLLLVASTNVALFVGAATMDEGLPYTICIANPSECTSLYVGNPDPPFTGTIPTEIGLMTALHTL